VSGIGRSARFRIDDLHYNLLNRVDEIWRLGVHKKKVEYNPEVDQSLTKCFRKWFDVSVSLAKGIERFSSRGYDVTGAAEFLSACREVEGILTPDGEFFTHRKFLALEAAAIKSNRSGQTAELRSMSD
jgi:hypothetical protein